MEAEDLLNIAWLPGERSVCADTSERGRAEGTPSNPPLYRRGQGWTPALSPVALAQGMRSSCFACTIALLLLKGSDSIGVHVGSSAEELSGSTHPGSAHKSRFRGTDSSRGGLPSTKAPATTSLG